MKCNAAGIDLIKKWEGLRTNPYQDIGGVWTVGYGHTGYNAKTPVTIQKANELLNADISIVESALNSELPECSINANQFSAIVSLMFNVGISRISPSALMHYVKKSQYDMAAKEFLHWNHVRGIVILGLSKRRQEEKELFEKEDIC